MSDNILTVNTDVLLDEIYNEATFGFKQLWQVHKNTAQKFAISS